MRRLANDLGVGAGALYYHVASKQDLLAAVAERILSDSSQTSATDLAVAARNIRDALLRVRDSAEVLSFVHVFKPDVLTPFRTMQLLFAARLPGDEARRAGQAAHVLVTYILGFVASEQNYAELARAKLASNQPPKAQLDDTFQFGLHAILKGLGVRSTTPPRPDR
jgi:AcrR family transcriptional regulator